MTILTFVNATSQSVSPLVIHKEQWHLKAPAHMKLSATDKGYIMKSKFYKYVLNFVKFLKNNGLADTKNVLIIDGHKSHLCNLTFYEAMRVNNIEILTIPPRMSHIIQPLDSILFAELKKFERPTL